MSKSAEREDSFAQQGESRVETGPVKVTRTVERFPAAVGTTLELVGEPRPIYRTVTVTERAPVISTTQTQTTAAGEAKEARSARFGWSPWTIAIGALVALAGLYGLWRVKGKLGV